MNMIIELVTKEAESCLKGGVIEGLSRFEQINHDIKIMRDCDFIDEETTKQLYELAKSYYNEFMTLFKSGVIK